MAVDIPWDNEASLLRITAFNTADEQEELVARGTVYELVGEVLEMSPAQQQGLRIRTSGLSWTCELDTDTIRELAARPEFTGAKGAYDTVGNVDDEGSREAEDQPRPEIGPMGYPLEPSDRTDR